MTDNLLYYGDNLDVLRRHVKDETVDLVYLDPPFNSKATDNALLRQQGGSTAAVQIKALCPSRSDSASVRRVGLPVCG